MLTICARYIGTDGICRRDTNHCSVVMQKIGEAGCVANAFANDPSFSVFPTAARRSRMTPECSFRRKPCPFSFAAVRS